MMETPVITVQSLSKQFRTAAQTVYAVRDVTFAIQRGEFVGIVGPSGSGKSTLLGLLGGLDTPSSGAVQLDGVDISHMRERELTRARNQKIGFVFQFFNLIPALTALENVALPLHFAHTRQFQPEKRALELLNLLGLRDRAHHRPAELSGGQQQRVAIARAIANNLPLILADEPTGNLNVEAGRLVLETLKQIREQSQTTIVVVTHDSYVAEQADRVLNLIDGRLVAADALTPDHSA